MTEIEFQNFLSGKCTLQDDINYHWFNLSRDLFFFNYDYTRNNKDDIVVFSTPDVYMQLFDFNGRLNVDNFKNLVNLSNRCYSEYYSSHFNGRDYWQLIKKGSTQDMMRFFKAKIITLEDEISYRDKIEKARDNIVKKNCFATPKKIAILESSYLCCGNTGTHIFSYKRY